MTLKNENFLTNKELREHKENITIIYFDSNSNRKTRKRIKIFREVNDYVLGYTNIDECVSRAQTIKKRRLLSSLMERTWLIFWLALKMFDKSMVYLFSLVQSTNKIYLKRRSLVFFPMLII